MAQQYHNPFASMDLIAPKTQRDVYDRYCQTSRQASVDRSPFPRMVDLWFAGLSFAVRKELELVNLSKQETFTFIQGSIFDRDSWRFQTVMLIAIAVDDDVQVVENPRRMMTIANGLAAAGVPHIARMLQDGKDDPIWNLSDAIDELLREEA